MYNWESRDDVCAHRWTHRAVDAVQHAYMLACIRSRVEDLGRFISEPYVPGGLIPVACDADHERTVIMRSVLRDSRDLAIVSESLAHKVRNVNLRPPRGTFTVTLTDVDYSKWTLVNGKSVFDHGAQASAFRYTSCGDIIPVLDAVGDCYLAGGYPEHLPRAVPIRRLFLSWVTDIENVAAAFVGNSTVEHLVFYAFAPKSELFNDHHRPLTEAPAILGRMASSMRNLRKVTLVTSDPRYVEALESVSVQLEVVTFEEEFFQSSRSEHLKADEAAALRHGARLLRSDEIREPLFGALDSPSRKRRIGGALPDMRLVAGDGGLVDVPGDVASTWETLKIAEDACDDGPFPVPAFPAAVVANVVNAQLGVGEIKRLSVGEISEVVAACEFLGATDAMNAAAKVLGGLLWTQSCGGML